MYKICWLKVLKPFFLIYNKSSWRLSPITSVNNAILHPDIDHFHFCVYVKFLIVKKAWELFYLSQYVSCLIIKSLKTVFNIYFVYIDDNSLNWNIRNLYVLYSLCTQTICHMNSTKCTCISAHKLSALWAVQGTPVSVHTNYLPYEQCRGHQYQCTQTICPMSSAGYTIISVHKLSALWAVQGTPLSVYTNYLPYEQCRVHQYQCTQTICPMSSAGDTSISVHKLSALWAVQGTLLSVYTNYLPYEQCRGHYYQCTQTICPMNSARDTSISVHKLAALWAVYDLDTYVAVHTWSLP